MRFAMLSPSGEATDWRKHERLEEHASDARASTTHAPSARELGSHPLQIAPKQYQPQATPIDIYQAMLLNRQEQARLHQERMLAPYQQMFSHRR